MNKLVELWKERVKLVQAKLFDSPRIAEIDHEIEAIQKKSNNPIRINKAGAVVLRWNSKKQKG